jgi:hypothetical protein
MSVCSNLRLDRPGCLAVYAGYVVLRACLRTRDRRSPYLHRIVPMSECANFQPDRPSRLAAYTGQNRTGQNVTETILEKYNIDYDDLILWRTNSHMEQWSQLTKCEPSHNQTYNTRRCVNLIVNLEQASVQNLRHYISEPSSIYVKH